MEKVRFWFINPMMVLNKIKGTNLEYILIYSERDKECRRYIIREKEE